MGDVSGRDFGVIVAVEGNAGALQLAARTIVIGERAVVHQAEIARRAERVGMLARDAAFRRHAGVADGVAADHFVEAKARRDVGRQAGALEYFQMAADRGEG